jgi:hypothetical protein
MNSVMIVVFALMCAGIIMAGILLVKHREKLWSDTRERQRKIFGKHTAGAFERLQNSFWVGFVGVFAMLAGLGLLVRFVVVMLS